jgi:hypothetical protein
METSEGALKTLLIANDHVRPLIDRFGLVKNELSSLIDLPAPSAGVDDAALAWWQARTDEEQYTFRAALAALASPALIADVAINIRNEKLISTHAIAPSLRWNDPLFLFAREPDPAQLRLEYIKQADIFANTLLLYLQGGAPLYEMEMKFELPVRDFAVLLGIIDLRQQRKYHALLDHSVYAGPLKTVHIEAAVAEGITIPDPRWLLPFCLQALHIRSEQFTPDTIRESIASLEKTGLVRQDNEEITFTAAGERFAESVSGRMNAIRIETFGVDNAGHPGRQSVIFIRGDGLLWYAGVSGSRADTIVVAAIGLDQAGKLIQELFTPVTAPKPRETPVPAQSPEVVQVSAPAAAASAPISAEKKFCPSCGKPTRPGLKFCSSCGAKIS